MSLLCKRLGFRIEVQAIRHILPSNKQIESDNGMQQVYTTFMSQPLNMAHISSLCGAGIAFELSCKPVDLQVHIIQPIPEVAEQWGNLLSPHIVIGEVQYRESLRQELVNNLDTVKDGRFDRGVELVHLFPKVEGGLR
jgi:hypothetical protein